MSQKLKKRNCFLDSLFHFFFFFFGVSDAKNYNHKKKLRLEKKNYENQKIKKNYENQK